MKKYYHFIILITKKVHKIFKSLYIFFSFLQVKNYERYFSRYKKSSPVFSLLYARDHELNMDKKKMKNDLTFIIKKKIESGNFKNDIIQNKKYE
jgi:hypothetical protein